MRKLSLVFFAPLTLVIALGQDVAPRIANDGNELLRNCRRLLAEDESIAHAPSAFDAGYCAGMVRGISATSPKVCYVRGETTGQDVRVVVKYLEDHPERLNLLDTVLVERALSEAFPCDKK